MTTSSSPSTEPTSSARSRDGDDAAAEPVRHARTSSNFALFWVILIVLSFAATLFLLFSASAPIQ